MRFSGMQIIDSVFVIEWEIWFSQNVKLIERGTEADIGWSSKINKNDDEFYTN